MNETKIAPIDVPCPICQAEVGKYCSTDDLPPGSLHASRIERALYARETQSDEQART